MYSVDMLIYVNLDLLSKRNYSCHYNLSKQTPFLPCLKYLSFNNFLQFNVELITLDANLFMSICARGLKSYTLPIVKTNPAKLDKLVLDKTLKGIHDVRIDNRKVLITIVLLI